MFYDQFLADCECFKVEYLNAFGTLLVFVLIGAAAPFSCRLGCIEKLMFLAAFTILEWTYVASLVALVTQVVQTQKYDAVLARNDLWESYGQLFFMYGVILLR